MAKSKEKAAAPTKSAAEKDLDRVRAEREEFDAKVDLAKVSEDERHEAARTLQGFDRVIERLESQVASEQ